MDVLVWVEKNSQEVDTFGIFFKTTDNEDNHLFWKKKLVDKIPQKYLTIENKYTNKFMNITITSGILILRFVLLFSVGVTRFQSVIVHKQGI